MQFTNQVHPKGKQSMIRTGDCLLVGLDPEQRRLMSDEEAEKEFDRLYEEKLEPAIRLADRIDVFKAQKYLKAKFHPFIKSWYRLYMFSIEGVILIAGINNSECCQLWTASGNEDPTRLSIGFANEDDKNLVIETARESGKDVHVWCREILLACCSKLAAA